MILCATCDYYFSILWLKRGNWRGKRIKVTHLFGKTKLKPDLLTSSKWQKEKRGQKEREHTCTSLFYHSYNRLSNL